jgi:transglutaminase-like putative cysteine protease
MTRRLYRYSLPEEYPVPPGTPVRQVRQQIVTRAYVNSGIPALGRIREFFYPRTTVSLHASGTISGTGHATPGQYMEVVSDVVEHTPEQLRRIEPVDPATFPEPEALALPQTTFEVDQLARQITQGETTNYDKVQAIVRYIEKSCTYTLEEEVTPLGEDAAAHYLFKSKRGACDLAATAAAVMCRAVNIPARVVIGYVAEEPLDNGGKGFLIRQEHAHMWFETFFPGLGWVEFNPAPVISSIKDHPLRRLWYRIEKLFHMVGGGGLDAILLVSVVLLTMVMGGYALFVRLRVRVRRWAHTRRQLRDSPGSAIGVLYLRGLRTLERRGWRREDWMTPREFLEVLQPQWGGSTAALTALETLTDCVQRALYARSSTGDLLATAAAALRDLSRAAPRRPGGRRGDRQA